MKQGQKKVAGNFVYKTSDVLGVGTWGTVYRASSKNQNDGKLYAIKKMNRFKIQASQKSFKKYESEVIALQKSTTIQEIIQIVDFFKTKSSYYIVTEYIEGSVDISNYMESNRSKFCELEVRRIWFDVLKGLKQLHRLGIYHRDLKPQNIIYVPGKQATAKIIDFGMATLFENTDGYVGSPMFMSPQVINHEKYTEKADIWSLGIIFYWMIFGVSPYGNTNNLNLVQEKIKEIEKRGIKFPEHKYLSLGCRQVIEGCLQFKESSRKSIDELLQLAFFNVAPIKKRKVYEYYEPETGFKT